MSFQLDRRIAELVAAGAGPSGSEHFASLRSGDAAGLRRVLDEGLAQLSALPHQPLVEATDHEVLAADGHRVPVRWYTRLGTAPGSAVVHFHGGARIAGSVGLYDPLVRTYVAWTGVPVLAVDYRLAPGAPAEAPSADGIAALEWLHHHAVDLGVDPGRIAVMGDSAGGGVAAAVAVRARDTGLALARQILVYPMLDHRRREPDPHLAAQPTLFSHEFEDTAWDAVLGDRRDDTDVSAYVAGTGADLGGVAPAFIEVGELDVFRDQCVALAQRLWAAGVSTELHVHPGMPHAYDVLLLGEQRLQADKLRILREL